MGHEKYLIVHGSGVVDADLILINHTGGNPWLDIGLPITGNPLKRERRAFLDVHFKVPRERPRCDWEQRQKTRRRKCNCPHETRSGCSKPGCPHYVTPRAAQADRPGGDGLPAEHEHVLGFVSDASAAIYDEPMVVWVDSEGEWWGGLPQSYIRLSDHRWTVDRWQSLPTHDGAEGAPVGEDTPYWRTLRPALVLPIEEQYAIAKDLAANCGYELTGDAYAAPPKPARPANAVLTDALHALELACILLPKGRDWDKIWRASISLKAALAAPVPAADPRDDCASHRLFSEEKMLGGLKEWIRDTVPPADEAKLADKLQGAIDFSDKFNGIAKIDVALLKECITALRSSPGTGAAEPGALEKYIPDIVKNAMLTMWNEICADTDCHLLDITHGPRKILWFAPRHWAELTGNMVARNIADLYATSPVRRDREAIARALAVAFHGDDVEWRGFLTKADVFSAALPVQPGAGERGRQWQWLPIEHRPLPSGKYLVGHHGTQEIMHFFGPEKEWVRGTQLGWRRLTDKGWVPDDPAMRFNATHCCSIELPPTSQAPHSSSEDGR